MIYLRIALMGATLGASVQAGGYLFAAALQAAMNAGENTHRIGSAIRRKKAAVKKKISNLRKKKRK